MTQHLALGRRLVAVDSSAECVKALCDRFAGVPDVEIHHADLRTFEPGRLFDSVLMINTLEHIADDVAALERLGRFLTPGGRAVIYVPAFNLLFSDYDRKVGHQRRYSKKMMTAVIDAAGMKTAKLRYVNVIGLPAWLIFSRSCARMRLTEAARLWDRTGTLASRWIEQRVEPPVGLNLLAVARLRPEAGHRRRRRSGSADGPGRRGALGVSLNTAIRRNHRRVDEQREDEHGESGHHEEHTRYAEVVGDAEDWQEAGSWSWKYLTTSGTSHTTPSTKSPAATKVALV